MTSSKLLILCSYVIVKNMFLDVILKNLTKFEVFVHQILLYEKSLAMQLETKLRMFFFKLCLPLV